MTDMNSQRRNFIGAAQQIIWFLKPSLHSMDNIKIGMMPLLVNFSKVNQTKFCFKLNQKLEPKLKMLQKRFKVNSAQLKKKTQRA